LSFPDVVDIAVHRSELFCLHGNGQLSHLSLLSAERCVERLLRREWWGLAASVCCMFPHAFLPSRVRREGGSWRGGRGGRGGSGGREGGSE